MNRLCIGSEALRDNQRCSRSFIEYCSILPGMSREEGDLFSPGNVDPTETTVGWGWWTLVTRLWEGGGIGGDLDGFSVAAGSQSWCLSVISCCPDGCLTSRLWTRRCSGDGMGEHHEIAKPGEPEPGEIACEGHQATGTNVMSCT